MRTSPRSIVITAWLIAGVLAPAFADEPPDATDPGSALVQDADKSAVDLWNYVQMAHSSERIALRAGFAHDTEGQLVLRILARSAPDAKTEFEEWTGPVTDQGWVPRRRVLVGAREIEEARRLREIVGAGPRFLTEAVLAASGAARADKPRPRIALSIEPRLEAGERRAVSLVGIDGRLHEVTQGLDSGIILSTRPVTEPPERVAVDVEAKQRSLPPLSVPGGVWFNTETPPTLGGLRGSLALVAVADPG